MVFIGGSSFGRRRRRDDPYGDPYDPNDPYNDPYGRRRFGPPRGYGYGPRYQRGYGGGGGGSCLRDMLFLDAGCCLAESFGCGAQLALVAPGAARTALRRPRPAGHRAGGSGRIRGLLLSLIAFYQREISATRPASCKYEPTCSHYAAEALERHGVRHGGWLAVRRLVRCRPGAAGGADPVPT